MKTLKSLLMLCAGLSFCACNSDNEPQFPEGKGAVTVKIVNPTTRTVGASAENLVVDGNVSFTLSHSSGTTEVSFTYDSSTGQYTLSQGAQNNPVEYVETDGDNLVFRFYNIGKPSSLAVSFNGGTANVGDFDEQITNWQDPSKVPAYGSTGNFVQTDNVLTHEDGRYQEWQCTINNVKIQLSRIEVQLTSGEFGDFDYVGVAGAYLDKIYPGGSPQNKSVVDYCLQFDNSGAKTGIEAILADNYMTADATLGDAALILKGDKVGNQVKISESGKIPGANTYYGYNLHPVGMPHFKLCLKVMKGSETTLQYAIINRYESSGEEIESLEPGTIYRITNLTLNDDNIGVNEEVGTLTYALTATVTKAQWTVVNTTGSWAQ